MSAAAGTHRPDTFVIGAPKCGTTAMYEYLKRHPAVYMSPLKEPRFFAPDRPLGAGQYPTLRYPRDLDRYLSLFAGASSEKRIGEASPQYIYSALAPQLIRQSKPDAHIIVLLRHPVDMIHSRHRQWVAQGYEPLRNLQDALDAEERRMDGHDVPADWRHAPELFLYRERARYSRYLGHWINVFGRDAVHVVVFEDLVDKPAEIMRGVFEYLNIDTEWIGAYGRYNARTEPRSHLVARAMQRAPGRELARRLLPMRVYQGIRSTAIDRVRRLNLQTATYAPLPQDMRLRLSAEFTGEVAALSDLVGRDLRALWFGHPVDA